MAEQEQMEFRPIEPHIIENQEQGHLFQNLVRGGLAFIATQKALNSEVLGGIGKKNAPVATALALGTSFLTNALNDNSSMQEALLATGIISGVSYYKTAFIKRDDSFYQRMSKLNNIITNIDGYHKRYQEAKLEAFQSYFVERDRSGSRLEKAIEVTKNSFNYILDKDDLKRSKAYDFLSQNKNVIEVMGRAENSISAKEYRELESSLPEDILGYTKRYFSMNRKIDNTSYDSTKMMPGVAYFTNNKKRVDDGYGNVDVLSAFRNNLNEEVTAISNESDRMFEEAKAYGKVNLESSRKDFYRQRFGITKRILGEYEKVSEELGTNDQNKIYTELVGRLKQSDDPFLQTIAERQAKSNELTFGDVTKNYNDLVLGKVKAIRSRASEIKEGNKINPMEEIFEDSFIVNNIKEIEDIKGNFSRSMLGENFRKDKSELLKSIINTNNKENKFNEFMLDYKGNTAINKIMTNMRVHKFLQKDSAGKVFDTSAADTKNLLFSTLASAENNLTPYFKGVPFIGRKLSEFNFASAFGLREKVVGNLRDSKLSAFEDTYYNHKGTMKELDATMASLKAVERVYRENSKINSSYTVQDALKAFNKRIIDKKAQGVTDASLRNSQARYIPGSNKIRSLDELQEMMKVVKESSIIENANSNKQGLRYKDNGMWGNDVSEMYKSFSFKIGTKSIDTENGKRNVLDIKLQSKMQNKNNVFIRNGNLYGRKDLGNGNSRYDILAENMTYTTNNFVKKVQSTFKGTAYTHDTAGQGIYLDKYEIPNNFNRDEFWNSENKFKYIRESDINFSPFSKRKPFNDDANIFRLYQETFSNNIATYKKLKDKRVAKLGLDDIFTVMTGDRLRIQGSKLVAQDEAELLYSNITSKLDYGFEDVKSIMKQVKNSDNRQLKAVYKKHKGFIDGYENKGFEDKVDLLDFVYNYQKMADNFGYVDKGVIDSKAIARANVFVGVRKAKVETDHLYKNLDPKKLTPDQVEEFRYQQKRKFLEKVFKNSGTYEQFENIAGKESLDKNLIFNKDTFRKMNRVDEISNSKATFMKKSFSDINIMRDGLAKSASKFFGEFSDRSVSNNSANILLMEMIEGAENVFNTVGVAKLTNENKGSGAEYMKSFLSKRILPMIGAAYAFNTFNSFSDAILPDWVPLVGEGVGAGAAKSLAAARMAMQVVINTTGMGFVFRTMEDMFPGALTGDGLFAPLDLSDTNKLMYEKLFEGREVAVRKNRFWYSSGRQEFQGGQIKEWRPHLLYSLQHRDKDMYDNKMQRFLRKDFLPTSLLSYTIDPYMEERKLEEQGTRMPKSEQLFTDIPIFGGMLNATFGELIKPTKYFYQDEWRVSDDLMLNSEYNPEDPNSQPFVRFKEPNFIDKALVPAYNDLTNLFGMRGYYIKKGTEFMFGSPNRLQDTTTLDSLDRHRGLSNFYEGLEWGGMFGTTEGIRRVISSDKLEQDTINPLQNTTVPEWMPKNYYKKFNYGMNSQFSQFADYGLPGEKFEKTQGLHSDDTYGEYGLLDRLRVLATNAPYSNEFRSYRREAVGMILSGKSTGEDMKHVLESLSYADSIMDKNVYEDTNQKAQLIKDTVQIDKMTDINEFFDRAGKRYKIAGVDIKRYANENVSVEEISSELSKYIEFINSVGELKIVYNRDQFARVKSDDKGEYIEIYSPELEGFKHIISDNYLRSNLEGRNPIKAGLNFFQNLYKPNYLEKSYNKKNAYERWYEENIITPQFKNWETPIDSFVAPMVNLSSNGFDGYLEAQNIAFKVGNGSAFLPLVNTVSFMKGAFMGPNEPKRYQQERVIQNTLEYQELKAYEQGETNRNTSFFNIQENDGFNRLKSYLSPVEKKYFNQLVNIKDEKERTRIYDRASNRMQTVLDYAWNRQRAYAGLEKQQVEQKMIDVANLNNNSYINSSQDSSLATMKIKRELGINTNSYEDVALAHEVSMESLRSNPEYIKRVISNSMLSKVKKQKILSTIFGVDANYIYNTDEN